MRISSKNYKYILFDALIIVASLFLGLSLRFDGKVPFIYTYYLKNLAIFIVVFKILLYYFLDIYKIYWRSAGSEEGVRYGLAIALSSIAILFFMTFKRYLPLSVIVVSSIIELVSSGLTRVLSRYDSTSKSAVESKKRILVIGAGMGGVLVLKELKSHPEMGRVVGLIDDDDLKQKNVVNGVKVVGKVKDIPDVVDDYKVDEIILAIPSANKQKKSEIINISKKRNVRVKVVPGIYEFIDGKIEIGHIRDVNIDDLLGRDPIVLNNNLLEEMIKDKTILVTGGGGSIGSELCRQIVKYKPKKLVILDIYENNAYDIQLELLSKYPDLDLDVCIESIRDLDRMEYIFGNYRPDHVFHAAAHKHVPLMEDSYISAMKNNVFGTRNLLFMADKYGVSKFVNISTDKAVNPTNIMGASKRIIEIMLQTINSKSKTDFVAVRFGNVLGSNGSVIPLFKKQIKEGGPVTVTHKDIIRYFMTIPEACQLVLQAGTIAKGGEIFILDMGEPVKILDLAENLIRLSGYKPYKDIKIEFTGLRPGEKLFEELILNLENSTKTQFKDIYIEKPVVHDEEKLNNFLEDLRKLVDGKACRKEDLIRMINILVPEFNHKENR